MVAFFTHNGPPLSFFGAPFDYSLLYFLLIKIFFCCREDDSTWSLRNVASLWKNSTVYFTVFPHNRFYTHPHSSSLSLLCVCTHQISLTWKFDAGACRLQHMLSIGWWVRFSSQWRKFSLTQLRFILTNVCRDIVSRTHSNEWENRTCVCKEMREKLNYYYDIFHSQYSCAPQKATKSKFMLILFHSAYVCVFVFVHKGIKINLKIFCVWEKKQMSEIDFFASSFLFFLSHFRGRLNKPSVCSL